jgi:hypothetical protein
VHPFFSLGLVRSSESLCLLLLMVGIIRQLGDDWELDDLSVAIVRGPTHDVNNCV